MWCTIVVLVCCCFFWLVKFVEETILCPLYVLCFVINCDHTQMGLILGSQFCSIDLWFFFFFSASTMLFLLLWLCSSLKSGSWITSALFFFLEITLAIWGRLWFHANFRIFISFLWNVFWIVIDCSLHCSLNL